jgi:ubiquinone/menaquinone biosynthesis C-methylase UbiE
MTSESGGDKPFIDDADAVAESTARLYDGIVDWYVESFFDDLSDADWLDRFASSLRAGRTELSSTVRAIDVGAGPGNFAKYLISKGMSVVSSDLSPEMVRASRRLVPEAYAVVADMRNLPFGDQSFDGVLCAYSLMHVPFPANRDALSEFARVLTPGGMMQLMLKDVPHSYQFTSSRVSGVSGLMQPWQKAELVAEVERLGFRVVADDARGSFSPHEFDHPKYMLLCRLQGSTSTSR